MHQTCEQRQYQQQQYHEAPAKQWKVDSWSNEVFKYEQDTLIKNKLGLIVHKRYEIIQRIDAGAFGSTYIAEDLESNRERVAVKFDTGRPEWRRSKHDENHLKYEYEVYKSALYEDGYEQVEGFAKVFWFGYQYGHNILVMELLGASVSSLFNFCNRKFGWQTILSLAQQMLHRIRHLHLRGFIHRDVKPENFLMGLSHNEITCYLIDFGLARRYRFRHPDDRTLRHIPFRRGRSFIGTAKYSSTNSHRNVELSRRDDLESLGYVIIELINGHLPWRNICRRNQANKHLTYQKIKAAKEQVNWKEACPSMFEYMKYCRELQFAEEPDYDKVLHTLRKALMEEVEDKPINGPKCDACKEMKDSMTTSLPECVWKEEQGEDVEDLAGLLKSTSLRNPTTQSSFELNQNHLSSDMIKPNLSAQAELRTSISPNSVKTREDDVESVTSCQNCRNRQQLFFDQACVGGQKLSWQIWRDSTPENRFEYDNRFSWTLPSVNKPNHFNATQVIYPPFHNHNIIPNSAALPTIRAGVPLRFPAPTIPRYDGIPTNFSGPPPFNGLPARIPVSGYTGMPGAAGINGLHNSARGPVVTCNSGRNAMIPNSSPGLSHPPPVLSQPPPPITGLYQPHQSTPIFNHPVNYPPPSAHYPCPSSGPIFPMFYVHGSPYVPT